MATARTTKERPKREGVSASVRAVIYCRISLDVEDERAGVTRQEADCRRYCADNGWDVVEVLIDNDISASRYSRKRRPGWAQVMELVEAKEVSALVAWDLDRLLRQPRELEDLIDRADRGLTVLTMQGTLDLASADGRAMARVMVAIAAKASDDTSRRVRRAKEAKAAQGLPMGDVRAFGWRHSVRATVDADAAARNGLDQVPDEAAAIREAARRVLAGEGITAIARSWNEAGYRRPRGATAWSSTTVRNVLTSPRNAGLVVHRGEIVGEAQWAAILDRQTYERVVATLNDPARRVGPRRRSTFTGVFRCGVCGQKLSRDASKGKVVWRCKPSPGIARCGKVGITGALVEPIIVEAVLRAVDLGDLPDIAEDNGAAGVDRDELSRLETRLVDLAELFAQGDISRREWLAGRRKVEEQLAAMRTRVGATRRGAILDPYRRGMSLRSVWDTLTDEQRNLVLLAVLDRVIVHPSSPERPTAPDRLEPIWTA